MAEAVAEAEVVEEEEGAQDDNFSPRNCYQTLGNFAYFFVQVLFMVSIFNKLKSEELVFPLLVKPGEGDMSCFWRLLQTKLVLVVVLSLSRYHPLCRLYNYLLLFAPQ